MFPNTKGRMFWTAQLLLLHQAEQTIVFALPHWNSVTLTINEMQDMICISVGSMIKGTGAGVDALQLWCGSITTSQTLPLEQPAVLEKIKLNN